MAVRLRSGVTWKPLKLFNATIANRREAAMIVRGLREKGVAIYRDEGHTPRGTSCIRLFVKDTQYEAARSWLDVQEASIALLKEAAEDGK